MPHTAQRLLFIILTSLAAATIVRAQEADTPKQAPHAESKPAAGESAPADSTQSDHSSTAGAQLAATSAASKQTQLPPVHVNGGPSDNILRSARDAGFKIKIADGKTHFCKTGAPVGTRFETENCMNEQQVTLWLERAREQKDKLMNLLGAPAVGH